MFGSTIIRLLPLPTAPTTRITSWRLLPLPLRRRLRIGPITLLITLRRRHRLPMALTIHPTSRLLLRRLRIGLTTLPMELTAGLIPPLPLRASCQSKVLLITALRSSTRSTRPYPRFSRTSLCT